MSADRRRRTEGWEGTRMDTGGRAVVTAGAAGIAPVAVAGPRITGGTVPVDGGSKAAP